jgi:hypothetical protein
VECLPSDLRGKLLSYFCDSKVGDAYLLTVSEEDAAPEIAQYLSPLRASFIAFEHRGRRVLEWARSYGWFEPHDAHALRSRSSASRTAQM